MFTYKKIIIASSICFITTIILGFAAYQPIFEFIIRNQVSLHKHNYLRQFYLKYPISLDLRVYFFNVTNPEEVSNGGFPVVKEVGPYCYDLYKERIDVVDNETEDSLTYSPHDTYFFNQKRSGDLNPEDYVTILHPLIAGIINYVEGKSPKLLPLVDKALDIMFPDNDIYLTARVKDILFDGMVINCTTQDFIVSAICKQLKLQMPGVVSLGKYDLKYSLLGPKNGTMPMRVTVLRGIDDNKNLGKLIAVDNKTKSDFWSTDECNEYRGTDGWIFPPFSGNLDRIWIHPTDLCVNLHADFIEESSTEGIRVRKFYAEFNQECDNCTDEEACAPKGMIDLSKCLKVPLFVSQPHFLNSDGGLLNQVKGLSPDEEKHTTRILLEETLSLPMQAHIRVQFNFPIKPLSAITIMKTVPKIIHPLLWVEMGVVIDGWFLQLVHAFFGFLMAMEVLKYVFLIGGLVGILYGFRLYSKNRKVYTANKTNGLKLK